MGNCGRIKESDECVRMMIVLQLNNYRISRLERLKYSLWWNHKEEYSNNESVEILTQNLIFSRFIRDEEGIRFVKEKIEELKEYNIRRTHTITSVGDEVFPTLVIVYKVKVA